MSFAAVLNWTMTEIENIDGRVWAGVIIVGFLASFPEGWRHYQRQKRLDVYFAKKRKKVGASRKKLDYKSSK
jgi:hypothetical protein